MALATLAIVLSLQAQRFDLEEVARAPAGPVFYDREGREWEAAGGMNHRLVTRQDLPDFLVDALRAREDARFFEHGGVDGRGLARALLRNLRDRRFTQGASTLSMQLARNTFQLKGKSLARKLLEIALTLRLEWRYTKDEILTHYLNTIYFGAGAHGIEQAAQTYFGKTTRNLSDGESALLVGIIRGPHVFSPVRNLPAALAQREQTLDRLVSMGLLKPARRDRLAAEPVTLASDRGRDTRASYALQAVRRELDRILEPLGQSPNGLKVETTLDIAWQSRLERELTRAVEKLEGEAAWRHPTRAEHAAGTAPRYVQFAAVTTERRTGATLALIGGRDFSHSRFDRTRSSRDLGSAFEPFVAAAAAEMNHPVLPGQPVQTGRAAGAARVGRTAWRCGLSGPFAETEDLFRGSLPATPQEVSVGLATLGNGGDRPDPHLIRTIHTASGAVIYQVKPRLSPALSARAARAAVGILQASGGTRNLIGATGSERDAWMLRLGPGGATALWIGFDQPAAIAPEPRLRALLGEFVERLENR